MYGANYKINGKQLHFILDTKTKRWSVIIGYGKKSIFQVSRAKGYAIVEFLNVLVDVFGTNLELKKGP